MCGIAGILALEGGRPPGRGELDRMIRRLRHRGPDGTGFYQDGPAGLAHSRLSIIDLHGGDQPIANEDRTIWTVFNGEIFNYVELRATLERAGHVFRTHSDTETIVHAYEAYGDDFVTRLNGQFAIAIWDERRRRLLLARDRMGIRPLLYRQEDNRLLFASEVKALRAAGGALRLDPQGLAQVFTFWSTVHDRTVFEGIHSLPPAHILSAQNGIVRVRRYWDWDGSGASGGFAGSFDQAAQELRQLLIDAVRLRLRADVPVGAYLSGGLDSAAIAALVRRYTDTELKTFSIAFEDSEFDESAHQQAVATHLRTEHTRITCRREQIGAMFPRLIEHAETPVLRTAPVPLMMLSGLVRQAGHKVVLTGEGADEVLGGYDLFKEAKVRRFWARCPQSSARPALLTRLYPYLRHSPVASLSYARSFYQRGLDDTACPTYAHLPRWLTTQRLWQLFSPELKESLSASAVRGAILGVLPESFAQWNPLLRDQYVEWQTLLAGYLLSSQGDRVAMANSVEGRFPFLDHRVVEFANRLPAKFKIRGLNEKAVLRRALNGHLPAPVLHRVKQPYRAPDSVSFFRNGKALEYVAELLDARRLRESGYFDAAAVGRLLQKCAAGRAIGFADNMAFVGILSTMLLDETLIRGAAPRSEKSVGCAPPAA